MTAGGVGGELPGEARCDAEPTNDPLARIRHDLRTPAGHIQGYAEMLQEEVSEIGLDGWIPDLKRIEASGRALIDMIRQELDPERLGRSKLDLRQLRAEFRTPLNHAVGYSEILLEQAGSGSGVRLAGDLQKIHDAAGRFLELLDELIVPANFEDLRGEGIQELPLARPDPLVWSRTMELPDHRESAFRGGVVLVVDDDPANRELLERRLRRQGFRVLTAADGESAMRLVRLQHVDLVLLDLVMAGMDGVEVLGLLKSDPALKEIPVVMLSAMDEMESVVRCLLMGAEDYLAKPFNSVLLQARIDACLEKRRLRRHEQAYLQALEIERQKSESLLRNILPEPIADRLKQGETTIVDSLPEVSILFADLVGFSELSARVSSVELVRLLDDIFSSFDELAEAQGLEKIKTIGDAYMVVGGLPTPRQDHAEAVAELALNILERVERGFEGERGPVPVRVRIGLNSGPVVAGIIGRSKFSYDLWGTTVNVASRMESLSLPGRIHVSEGTFERLRHRYDFESRGEVAVKGGGRMATWFLVGRKG